MTLFMMLWASRPHIWSISSGVRALLGILLTNICVSSKPSPDSMSASAIAEPSPPP